MTTAIAPPKIIRRLRGYAIEWHHYYSFGEFAEDHTRQFGFMPGAFDASLSSGKPIALTQDLNHVPFASTADGTLRIESTDVGLLVTASLVDCRVSRDLIALIDRGRVKGWSHDWRWSFGGHHIRQENGVEFYDSRPSPSATGASSTPMGFGVSTSLDQQTERWAARCPRSRSIRR